MMNKLAPQKSIKCPVCSSKNHRHYHTFTRYRLPFEVWQCNDCHSKFQVDVDNEAQQFYDQSYYEGAADYAYQDDRKNFEANDIVYQARLRQIRKLHPHGNFLDIGCGLGGFVAAASLYFNADGLDVSSFAVKAGNNFLQQELKIDESKARLYQGSAMILPRNVKQKQYDVITLVEVAEHIAHPQKAFTALYHILREGGLLVIQTANFEGRQATKAGVDYHYFMPGHLTYYTATALKNMLSKIGFRKFVEYIPVDFGVWPKLKKSYRLDQKNFFYFFRRALKIMFYHFKSKLRFRGKPLTSSYVLYAIK